MPDPSLSAAIREAYASAPVGQVIHHTLEIWHPAFSVPIRVVRDKVSVDARLEAGAPRNPGELVTFIGYAFDIVPPDQTATGLPQCVIEIDNVDRLIEEQLDQAAMSSEPVTVLYREFLSDAREIGPENIPPLEMTLISVNSTPMRIRAVAGFPDLLNLKFPKQDYGLRRFRGLQP